MAIRLLAILFFSVQILSVQAQQSNGNFETGQVEVQTTSAEILGEQVAAEFANVIKSTEQIKWSIYVPENFDPASPPGIVVHMTQNLENRNNLTKLPIGWASAMEEKNLIWISIRNAGWLKQNKEMILSVLATPFLQKRYKIDRNRIYIVASANSCYAASAAMEIYPDIFKGVIYSVCEPLNWRKDIPETIEQMKENRYLFVSGNERSIKQIMRQAYSKYADAGITKIEYKNIRKLNYGKHIDRRELIKSLEILDNLN